MSWLIGAAALVLLVFQGDASAAPPSSSWLQISTHRRPPWPTAGEAERPPVRFFSGQNGCTASAQKPTAQCTCAPQPVGVFTRVSWQNFSRSPCGDRWFKLVAGIG